MLLATLLCLALQAIESRVVVHLPSAKSAILIEGNPSSSLVTVAVAKELKVPSGFIWLCDKDGACLDDDHVDAMVLESNTEYAAVLLELKTQVSFDPQLQLLAEGQTLYNAGAGYPLDFSVLPRASEVFKKAITVLHPEDSSRLAIAWTSLVHISKYLGDYDAMRQAIISTLAHTRGTNSPVPTGSGNLLPHGIYHDLEQIRYLLRRGYGDRSGRAWLRGVQGAYEVIHDIADAARLSPKSSVWVYNDSLITQQNGAAAEWHSLPEGYGRRVLGWHGRSIHLAWDVGSAVQGGAISMAIDTVALEKAFVTAPAHHVMVIDNFLTPEALRRVREFSLASTVWFDVKERLQGAYLQDGFAAPILTQIAHELTIKFPHVFQGHALHNLWAYKYQAEIPGIEIHADEAAVNCNLWITPTEAYQGEPGRGGLVVYHAQAPLEWDTAAFNAYGQNRANVDQLLADSGWENTIIPYQQNRMVIFRSNLFHKTDSFRFRKKYEDRRINITFLFGGRGTRLQTKSLGR